MRSNPAQRYGRAKPDHAAPIKRHSYATVSKKDSPLAAVPTFLHRGRASDNFRTNGMAVQNNRHVQQATTSTLSSIRPSTSGSEKAWAIKSRKLVEKSTRVIANKKAQHRLKSLTMRPPVAGEASLVPDDMRLSTSLPPPVPSGSPSDIRLLESWLEKAEIRLRRRKLTKRPEELIIESQLLYSSCFSELTRQISEVQGLRTAEFLRRVWQLYQIVFDNFSDLYNTKMKETHEINARLQKRVQHLEKHGLTKHDEKTLGFGGLRASVANIVLGQLANIRKRRVEKLKEEEHARLVKLMNPDHENESKKIRKKSSRSDDKTKPRNGETAQGNDDTKDTSASGSEVNEVAPIDMDLMDEAERLRAEAMAMAYSGCADRLDTIATGMLHSVEEGKKSIERKSSVNTRRSSKRNEKEWVLLPGATASMEYFSALATLNVDLTATIKRGQRIRIGPRTFVVNENEGKFTSDSMPLDKHWPSPAAEGLSIYIRRADSQQSAYDDADSDMDDDIDWVLLPATVSVTKGDVQVFTTCDVSKLLKRGSRVKIAGSVFAIGTYGHFNEESFPLSTAWVNKAASSIPLFADVEGIIGWDAEKDAKDLAKERERLANEVIERDEDGAAVRTQAIWIQLVGLTVNVSKGSSRARTSADATMVLRPGQVISIGPHNEVFHVADPNKKTNNSFETSDKTNSASFSTVVFNPTSFTLDRNWEQESGSNLVVRVRRHEIKVQSRRLRMGLRCLGIRGRALDPDVKYTDIGIQVTLDAPAATLHSNAGQTNLTAAPDEMLEDSLMNIHYSSEKEGDEKEWAAARYVMKMMRRSKKRGTDVLSSHATLQIFDLLIQDKLEADNIQDMLQHPRLSVPQFCSDWFVQRFGLKSVADKNLGRFMLSLHQLAGENAYARIGARMLTWYGQESTHLSAISSSLLLEDYKSLAKHPVAFVELLAGKTVKDAHDTESNSTLSNSKSSKRKAKNKNSSAIQPRCTVLAAWDVLRERMLAYSCARHHFATIKAKSGKRRRSHWLNLQSNSFVAKSFRKIEERAHKAKELYDLHEVSNYIEETLSPPGSTSQKAAARKRKGKPPRKRTREQVDASRVRDMAVDLYEVLEIVSDACKECRRLEMEKDLDAARTLFRAADSNKDGILTLDEFKVLISSCGVLDKVSIKSSRKKKKVNGMQQHQIISLYRKCLDINGQITADSFAALVKINLKRDQSSNNALFKMKHVRKMAKEFQIDNGITEEGVSSPAGDGETDEKVDSEKDGSLELMESERTLDKTSDTEIHSTRPKSSSPNSRLDRKRTSEFVCKYCGREFVREKGLYAHQESECTTAKKKSDGEESLILDKDDTEESKVATTGDDDDDSNEIDYDFTMLTENQSENFAGDGYANADNNLEDEYDRQSSDFFVASNLRSHSMRVLSHILRQSSALGWDIERVFKELDQQNSGFISIRGFQDVVEGKFGFRPTKSETSAFFLSLDTDRSGDIEKQEFELFAKLVMSQLEKAQNVEKSDKLQFARQDDVKKKTEEGDIIGLGNRALIDVHDSSWQLLESYWLAEEPTIRKHVHDFGSQNEKVNLVLLDELIRERNVDASIEDAWQCFRELTAFANRLRP